MEVITLIDILSKSLKPFAIIENYTNDSIDELINGEYKFTFTAVIDEDGKSEYLVDGNLVEVEGQLFNIVHHRRTRANDGSLIVAVDCEQASYDLLEFEWEAGFVQAGTPRQLLNMVLSGTGFTVGTVELSGYISVDLAEENVSARAILMEIAAQSGGELLFDRYKISLLFRRGQERGVDFRLGKNLRGIIKDVDIRSGEVITAYEIEIVELNSLAEFEGLEYFELGDTVHITDPELGIDEAQRIVGYSYSPRLRMNSKVTISNKIPGIKDAMVALRKTTVVKDKYYYGTRFGPEIGFECVRSDNMSRSVFNSDEFRMQIGDGSGSSWTDALFFNPAEGLYEFTGIVIAAQFIGGKIVIGSGNDVFVADERGIHSGHADFDDAPFSVDMQGRMKVVDGEFKGKIIGSEIVGSDLLGNRIRTAETGDRIELDQDGFVFFDSGNRRRVTLGTNYEAGISGHTYYNSSGSSQGLVYASSDELHVIGVNGMLLRALSGSIVVQGVIDFRGATVLMPT